MHVMFNFTKVMALNNEVDIFSQTRLENAKLKVIFSKLNVHGKNQFD